MALGRPLPAEVVYEGGVGVAGAVEEAVVDVAEVGEPVAAGAGDAFLGNDSRSSSSM